jgi:alpha-2-macroglobulin
MSKRLLLTLAAVVTLAMLAIPFLSQKSNSAVGFSKLDPAYAAYVSAYTSGVISNESYIRVTLAEDYKGAISLDKAETEKYFSFSPAIEGQLFWLDNRTLEFRPAQRLPSDQVYEAEFFLSKLVPEIPSNLKTMQFGFRTMRQSIDVSIDGMRTTDRQTLRLQQMRGTLNTADGADSKAIEQTLTVTQDGKPLKINWTHEGNNVTHTFTVDNIKRSEKEGKVTVEWNGEAIGAKTKDSKVIAIPALGDFKVVSARAEQGQEQCVIVQFSDPIAERQNLDGLISIKDAEGLRFSIEDNDVRVYPLERLTGSHALTVQQGVKNTIGKELPHSFTQSIEFELMKPEVRLSGKGVILPNSPRGLTLPFQAVGLKSVDVKVIRIYEKNIPQFLQVNSLDGSDELYRVGKVVVKKKIDLSIRNKNEYNNWTNYSVDLGELIRTEPGAIYRVSIGFKRSYAVVACDSVSNAAILEQEAEQERSRQESEEEEGEYSYYGGGYYDNYYYYDDYGDHDDPCSGSYYYGRTVSRNVLASDLGLLAKRGNDGSVVVAVNNLRTTDPVGNAQVEVYDFQHQLLTRSATDAQGLASLSLKKKPFLLIASSGNQRGYLKLDDGSSLSLGAFDVSGATVQKGLKGMIYGERGVWRPGDTLFLGFILEDKENKLPQGHPVTFELNNPRGQLVNRVVRSASVNGFYNFTTPTDADAPTGNWTARVKVGGATFTKTVKVETIMPNRLKINMGFANNVTLLKGETQPVKMDVKWLHGAIAKNLRANVEVSFYEAETKFKGFDNFVFDDPATNFYSENKTVYDGRLDDNGHAEFSPDLSASNAPGMLRASFNTRVFEQGGAFSVDRFSINYSPFTHYVGVLVPKGSGWGGMLETDRDYSIPIVSVNQNGAPEARSKLTVKIYKMDWRWWWSSSYNDMANYVNSSYYNPYYETQTTTDAKGRGAINVKIGKEDWGRYLIRITDEESGHSTGSVAWFDWPYGGGGAMQNSEAATMLQFSSDKKQYKVGDKIKLTIPSPGQGRALISVENGSRIISTIWAETKAKGNISTEIAVTAAMAPNVYVHVTLLQPHAQVKNDAPIRLYGVIPIEIDNAETHIEPVIATKPVWAPEETVNVAVSEKNGKAMTYTLAIVDEGLLDITRFKTPDPWANFYAREALGVKTWDMYDMVMGAYGAELERVLGIGGDGDNGPNGGQKANRFKPMVRYIGPFELKKGGRNDHKISIPQYVGSVRVMVIAGQNAAYGKAETAVPVRKPLMILGTLPRVVGPGETVDLPVNIFAMEKFVKNVSVTVTTDKMFSVDGAVTKTVRFNEVGEQVETFRLNVAKIAGVGKVRIVATSGKERAVTEIEIDVRNPNTRQTNVIEAAIDPGQSWTSAYTPAGIAGTNSGKLELSTIPPLNLGRRLDYLMRYPHGCVEQTTSAAFPQLYLSELMTLGEERRKVTEANVKAAINRLRSFQTPSGALGYWPGDQTPSEWGTNYAGHFLLEAEEHGYSLPAGLIDNWKKFQRQQAISWTPRADQNYYYNDDLVQAYRLYTLAKAKAPELGAMNRLREHKSLNATAKWRLAAAYQLAGQPEIAKQMIAGLSTVVTNYAELSYTFGSDERDLAMILETLSLMGQRTKAAPAAKMISEELNRNSWMSTQTTAYCLLSLSEFATGDKTAKGVNCTYTVNGKQGTANDGKPVSLTDISITGAEAGKVTIKNNGTGTVFVRIMLTGVPEAGMETPSAEGLSIDVKYLDNSGLPLDVSKIEQGTDFVAVVTVGNTGVRGEYRELALSQIFPSGWEIRNERMEEGVNRVQTDPFNYQDIRDDRVFTYFSIAPQRTRTYRVRLNAAYTGRFYMPGFSAEAMYDASINARNVGQWVEVVGQETVK